MKLVTVQEMILIERAADLAGHTYDAMMEQAGKGLAEEIIARYGYFPDKVVIALVGSGNNGGDALIALEYLQNTGWKSTALICKKRSDSDPLEKRFRECGGKLIDWWSVEQTIADIDQEIHGADLIIDGILGTGITLPLTDPLKTLLGKIKARVEQSDIKPIIVAVDCPSGIDCNTATPKRALCFANRHIWGT